MQFTFEFKMLESIGIFLRVKILRLFLALATRIILVWFLFVLRMKNGTKVEKVRQFYDMKRERERGSTLSECMKMKLKICILANLCVQLLTNKEKFTKIDHSGL